MISTATFQEEKGLPSVVSPLCSGRPGTVGEIPQSWERTNSWYEVHNVQRTIAPAVGYPLHPIALFIVHQHVGRILRQARQQTWIVFGIVQLIHTDITVGVVQSSSKAGSK